MKIIFYEIRDFEFNYLLDKIPATLEPSFIKCALNEPLYTDERQKATDAISVFVSSKLTEDVLSKFKNLKYIFLRCAGYSNVDLSYCQKNNIKIFNTPSYGSSTVAEYVFLLILALYKKLNKTISELKEGNIDSNDLTGTELSKKTIGVIGTGNIGRKVVNIAYGFNMNVLAYDIKKQGAYNYVELEELLSKSDIVSINCPLNDNSRQMINKYTLSLMKKEAVLINTSRGEIVSTKDLYTALINKKISGAGLDVIECEELLCRQRAECNNFDNLRNYCLKKYFFLHKLTQLENVIITPHNAYNTAEANKRILKTTLDNINSCLNNELILKNQVILT